MLGYVWFRVGKPQMPKADPLCYYWGMNWEVLVHCKAVWRSVGSIVRWGKRKGWLPFSQCDFLPASGKKDFYTWFFHPRTTFSDFFRSINILFMKLRNGRSRVTSILNLCGTFVIEMDLAVKYKAHIDYIHIHNIFMLFQNLFGIRGIKFYSFTNSR